MRKIIIPLIAVSLSACVEVKVDDLEEYVVKTKAKVYPINDKVPALKKIDALDFTAEGERTPFTTPKAEVAEPTQAAPKSCPQPDFSRKKQSLEMYSLESLVMRGTLLVNGELWALVGVPSGELHKVKTGYYMGLNHGNVLKITKNKVELLELASDGNGCWQERITQLELQSNEE